MSRSFTSRVASWLVPRFMANLRLRTRFIALLIAAVVVFGSVNFLFIDSVAGRVLAAEVENRARATARLLAAEAAGPILQQDTVALRRILAAAVESDGGLGYALVLSSDGEVVVSTFSGGAPRGLAAAHRPPAGDESTILVLDRGTEFSDVAVPVLDGRIGTLRVGARLDRVRSALLSLRLALLGMVVAFLVAGILGAHLMAHLIASPVETLAAAALRFDPARPPEPVAFDVPARGEIADLARSFEAMAARLHQLHEDRQAFQDRIVRAERLATVGALASGIAHEVNNPLAGLRNCLQAISREPEDVEQTRSYARMMIEASHSIERTVRSLIDVAARSRPAPSTFDVCALTERVELLVRHRFVAAGVRLEIECAARLGPVRTDEGLLQQILVNLLLNAADASPRGEAVKLQVRVEAGQALLEVIDRGTGIAPEVRERIFDPFVTTKAERGGTGLGLAMVKTLVQDLDGTVTFESAPGRGTRFLVALPAAEARERSG
ncbi:MAG: HAMP domain-containing histidine kinase [Deltaproteobacteria bacterium]|nr:HAMP domain-containing histidine kinase [Deltaproteobacteria bacterium]